jgi:hypothetical protein
VNCAHGERTSTTATRKDPFKNTSGLAVGLKRKSAPNRPETPPETTTSCSNVQGQLQDISRRLRRLEDKVGSDLEGIYEILTSLERKMNERDSVV